MPAPPFSRRGLSDLARLGAPWSRQTLLRFSVACFIGCRAGSTSGSLGSRIQECAAATDLGLDVFLVVSWSFTVCVKLLCTKASSVYPTPAGCFWVVSWRHLRRQRGVHNLAAKTWFLSLFICSALLFFFNYYILYT